MKTSFVLVAVLMLASQTLAQDGPMQFCNNLCKTCTQTACTACYPGNYLIEGVCMPCSAGCKTCAQYQTSANSNCTACHDGFVTKTVTDQPTTCVDGLAGSATIQKAEAPGGVCPFGFFLKSSSTTICYSSGIPATTCPAGTYSSTSLLNVVSCTPCSVRGCETCAKTNFSYQTCSKCQSGWNLEDGGCCKDDYCYYANPSQVCKDGFYAMVRGSNDPTTTC